MEYVLFFVLIVLTNITVFYETRLWCKKKLYMKDNQIQALRANFAIYYNVSEMEILYLKDELKKIDSKGADFSEYTRKDIEKTLKEQINGIKS